MHFDAPQMFLLLPLVPLLAWLLIRSQSRRAAAQRNFADPALFAAISATERPAYARLHIVLITLACLLVILALARPKGGFVEEALSGEGIDIVFALDISRSMAADDLGPPRLQVMKEVAKALVDQNPGDRVGAVAFAGEAFVLCPLTLDHVTAKTFIDALSFEPNIKQGTAIGDAITTAIQRFDSQNSRVLILFTDGESNQGVDPIQAARQAAERGIKIYTVGIGTQEGAQLMESRDPFFGVPRPRVHRGSPVVVGLDQTTLREISRITGGTYVEIASTAQIAEAFVKLDKSARQVFEAGARQVRQELGPWLLAAAALVLWIDFLIELYRVSPLGFQWLRGTSRSRGEGRARLFHRPEAAG